MAAVLLKGDVKMNARPPSWMHLLSCIACYFLGCQCGFVPIFPGNVREKNLVIKAATANFCPEPMINQGVPTFKYRNDLGSIVEEEKMTIGVELGVKQGDFSKQILKRWPSCKEYHLVDLWAKQKNYADDANVDQPVQNQFYSETLENLKEWKDKLHICRNYTSVCVENIPDGYFDFIHVDARHDFKGVDQDLHLWWPKLRVGGIMAGHDYVTQNDGPQQYNQNWALNYDGTTDETGTVVKGAVDKFAKEVCRQLTISYREPSFNTWAMRK